LRGRGRRGLFDVTPDEPAYWISRPYVNFRGSDEPVLAIGEKSVRFPVRLMDGQRLVCRDQATWRVLGADGAEVAAGQVAGTFPTLLPGANRVTLASQAQPAADFRVIVKTVKVYR